MFHEHHLRHVDVAILYALGRKDRAQHIARQMRPMFVTADVEVDVDIENANLVSGAGIDVEWVSTT